MAMARQPTNISGDYAGDLAGLPIKLHLTDSPDGTLGGTMDSPNQGAAGDPLCRLSSRRRLANIRQRLEGKPAISLGSLR